jgi:catechol 2,3-dioxygenase-like lactoylglutathione lyase family enzyme
MGYHHIALATRDLVATHGFYTEAMGFELVKSVVAPTDVGGWAKHLFYDTGDGTMVAFWELHDDRMTDFDPAISTGLGLEPWVNHVAFATDDLEGLEAARERWLDLGHDVIEVDHGFCASVYTMDPNGILVEWCTDTAPLTEDDRRRALEMVTATAPDLEDAPVPVFHRGRTRTPA